MSHDDFDFEPQPGIPAPLPAGEHLLWQGRPDWKTLAIRGYHARKAAYYFAFLMSWRIGTGLVEGHTVAAVAASCAVLLVMGVAVVAILSTLAYFSSRSAVFSITSRRVLLRHGVAVPMTLNIPFSSIQSADLKLLEGSRGDIVLRLAPDQRIGYLITWPFLRAGQYAHPQPNLRALDDAAGAAAILRDALLAFSGQKPAASRPAPQSVSAHDTAGAAANAA